MSQPRRLLGIGAIALLTGGCFSSSTPATRPPQPPSRFVVTYFPWQGDIHPVKRPRHTAMIVCTPRDRALCAAVAYIATHPPRRLCLTSSTLPEAFKVVGSLRGRSIETRSGPVCEPTPKYAAAEKVVGAAFKQEPSGDYRSS